MKSDEKVMMMHSMLGKVYKHKDTGEIRKVLCGREEPSVTLVDMKNNKNQVTVVIGSSNAKRWEEVTQEWVKVKKPKAKK